MTNKIVLYSATEHKYSRRFWRLFGPYFALSILFILPPLLNLNGFIPIIIFWYLLISIFVASILYNCYKWSNQKVSSIISNHDNFEIEILKRDRSRVFIVEKQNIKISLRWFGGRLRLLRLTISDRNLVIADLYSGGREKEAQELEQIKFQIESNSP